MIPAGGGEIVGDAPERRVEILSDHDALHATWSRYGPRRDGADLHVHRSHTDLFYVLDGELTIRLGIEDEGVPVSAGKLVRVPPLVVHGFRNASDADVSYLNLHAPGQGFASFMRAMRDGRELSYDQHPPPADGGRPKAEAAIGGEAFRTETPGGRIALLVDVDEIGVAEIRSEPGGPRPPPHVHRHHLESLYVLEGEIAVTSDGRELRAGAGSWVRVPPGTPHAISVSGTASARYLELHTPCAGFGEFVRALGETGDAQLAAQRSGFDQKPAA
jgi:mannose-6-phosphate isomerase-like protein (cupin superfamily)